MTDTNHSNPDDPTKSGAHKITTPKDSGKHVATKIDVQDGTREHTVTVQQVADELGDDRELPERRRQQSGTQVNVGAGGVTGKWVNVTNLTGVGAMFIMAFLFYRDLQANQREYMAQAREDRISERSQDQAANAAIIGAVTSLAAKIDARDTKLETAIDEARLARAEGKLVQAEQKQLHQEILAVLKAIRDKGAMDPEAMAPMPRKVSGAG